MKSISDKVVYQNGPLKLRELIFEDNKGKTRKRNLLEMGCDAVVIVPQNATGDYLLCTQTRQGMENPGYEFPSGGIEGSENPIDAARRELLEETGSISSRLEYKGSFVPLLGLVDLTVHIVYAYDVVQDLSKQELEGHEDISTEWLSKDRLYELMNSGIIRCGYVSSALKFEDFDPR